MDQAAVQPQRGYMGSNSNSQSESITLRDAFERRGWLYVGTLANQQSASSIREPRGTVDVEQHVAVSPPLVEQALAGALPNRPFIGAGHKTLLGNASASTRQQFHEAVERFAHSVLPLITRFPFASIKYAVESQVNAKIFIRHSKFMPAGMDSALKFCPGEYLQSNRSDREPLHFTIVVSDDDDMSHYRRSRAILHQLAHIVLLDAGGQRDRLSPQRQGGRAKLRDSYRAWLNGGNPDGLPQFRHADEGKAEIMSFMLWSLHGLPLLERFQFRYVMASRYLGWSIPDAFESSINSFRNSERDGLKSRHVATMGAPKPHTPSPNSVPDVPAADWTQSHADISRDSLLSIFSSEMIEEISKVASVIAETSLREPFAELRICVEEDMRETYAGDYANVSVNVRPGRPTSNFSVDYNPFCRMFGSETDRDYSRLKFVIDVPSGLPESWGPDQQTAAVYSILLLWFAWRMGDERILAAVDRAKNSPNENCKFNLQPIDPVLENRIRYLAAGIAVSSPSAIARLQLTKKSDFQELAFACLAIANQPHEAIASAPSLEQAIELAIDLARSRAHSLHKSMSESKLGRFTCVDPRALLRVFVNPAGR